MVLWNTRYIDAAVAALRAGGHPVGDEDAVHLSPLGHAHINMLGRYTFPPRHRGQGCARSAIQMSTAAEPRAGTAQADRLKVTLLDRLGRSVLHLGLRWPVERTNSWLSNFGQLHRNTDRFLRQRLGQIALAIALILTMKLFKWAKRWTGQKRPSARS